MILTDLWRRARALLLRSKLDRDLDDELQAHVELEAQKYVLAGVHQDEALRRAHVALGSRAQAVEECRSVRGLNLIENVGRDCRFALRAFRRSPAFALTVVLIVATAIGANTTVISFCHAILLSALPIPNPYQLYLPTVHFPGSPEIRYFSYPDLRHMQEACKPAGMTGFTDVTAVHVLDRDGTTSTVKGQLVAENFFSTMSVTPLLGRAFTEHDNRAGIENVAALSYRFWSAKYASDPSIIGRRLTIQNAPVTVLAVMPPNFAGVNPGERLDIWMPLSVQGSIGYGGYASMNNVDWKKPWLWQDVSWLHVIGRSVGDPNGTRLHAALAYYLKREINRALATVRDPVQRSAMLAQESI